MISLALLAAASTAPALMPLRTFSDWAIGCDNGRNCQANALQPEEVGGEVSLNFITMVLTRDARAASQPEISITVDDLKVVALLVGPERIPVRPEPGSGLIRIAGAGAVRLIAAANAVRHLSLVDARGAEVARVSLDGMNAALLHMDDRQKRVGTITALVRKGPAKTVSPPPALPVIVSPAVPKLPPRSLTKADMDRSRKPLMCEGADESLYEPSHVRLDARTTLALLPWPCNNGAYNYFASALLIDQQGKISAASFDAPPGMDDEIGNEVVNADWNADERLLSTYAKGRGLGDCGMREFFAWDGSRFRLVHREDMSECRGSADFITTWRATVSPR